MAIERKDADASGRRPGRRWVLAAPVLVVILVALAIWLAVGGDDRGGASRAGGVSLTVESVAATPARYLGERVEVRGRVGRVGEGGFVLRGGGRSLVVLAPTGGAFPRVQPGDVVGARGRYRALEPAEVRRLERPLAATARGRALVALGIDTLGSPAPDR